MPGLFTAYIVSTVLLIYEIYLTIIFRSKMQTELSLQDFRETQKLEDQLLQEKTSVRLTFEPYIIDVEFASG